MLQATQNAAVRSRESLGKIQSTVINARQRFMNAGALVQAEKTPFEVIWQEDIVRLRYYPPLSTSEIEMTGESVPVRPHTHSIPLVLVAPLAVNMFIYDLFPERSLVKYLRAQGFELYMIDWGKPAVRHNHFNLAAYYETWMPKLLQQVRTHSGSQKLSLHGWSMGGLFSLCYTALGDEDIENLVLVGAPCDYHANGLLGQQYQKISRNLAWLEQKTGWKVHDTRKRWWRSPGWANALAFKLTNPVNSARGYWDLLKNLHREEYVISHATNGAFLDDMVAYPGATIQDVIQYLWVENTLAHGKLPQRAPRHGLENVRANVLLICGEQDNIVNHDCSTAMLKHLSSTDVTVKAVPGGHMGILGGSKAPHYIWPDTAAWLAARSGSDKCEPGR